MSLALEFFSCQHRFKQYSTYLPFKAKCNKVVLYPTQPNRQAGNFQVTFRLGEVSPSMSMTNINPRAPHASCLL